MMKLLPSGILLISFLSFSLTSFADVVINGTRIIFNSKYKEVAIQLKNQGSNPYLIQSWIDDGIENSKPGEAKVPFIITPPVTRIDPGKGQAVRILATNPALPHDRETLFWFNMLEIPPKPKASESGNTLMQLAFRTRIKMFYRPDNLKTSHLEAYRNVGFSLQGDKLKVKNDSPYFITFKNIDIRKDKNSSILGEVISFPKRMLSPGSETIFPIKKKYNGSLTGKIVTYSVINDYGGETTNEQILQGQF